MQIEKFLALLEDIVENQLPDLHVTSGTVPSVRKHDGDLDPVAAF